MQNYNSKFKIFQFFIILLLVILPLSGFIYLLERDFVFNGVWDVETGLDKKLPLIEVTNDGEKGQINNDVFRSFEKTPIYFSVKAPRVFEIAQVESMFRTNAALVETGVVVKEEMGQIRKTVVYNRDLEELGWTKITAGNPISRYPISTKSISDIDHSLMLWQKNQRYANSEEFLKSPPSIDKIMTINYDLTAPVRLVNYHASSAMRIFNVSLRGPQTLYTYLEKENLNWAFIVQNMNRHDGADEVMARVFDYQNNLVLEKKLVDDGEVWGSGKGSTLREIKLQASLPDGVYKIQILAPDDIFIRRFSTSQQKFVFQYVIYLADTAGYSGISDIINIAGQTRTLKFRTPHDEGKQNIQIGWDQLQIAAKDQSHQYHTKTRLINFRVPKPDLKIDFDGFLTLAPEIFFLPKPFGFKWASDINQFGVEYIVGNYQSAIPLRQPYKNWFDVTGDLSLDGVDQSKKIKMFLVASSKSDSEAPLNLTDLRIVFKKEPFNFGALPVTILNKVRQMFIWAKF